MCSLKRNVWEKDVKCEVAIAIYSIKVIKREQKLVLIMMWRVWELIWQIMMDLFTWCLKKGENVAGVKIDKMGFCIYSGFSGFLF